MTRYLDSRPFSNRPATREYRDGWEATFGKPVKKPAKKSPKKGGAK